MRKRRSAKQLANDRRLGRMAKKRAAARRRAKNPGRTVARKAPRIKRNPKRGGASTIDRSLWLIFRARNSASGPIVEFESMPTPMGVRRWTEKKHALRWPSKEFAATQARRAAREVSEHRSYPYRSKIITFGVVPNTATANSIKAGVKAKLGKA